MAHDLELNQRGPTLSNMLIDPWSWLDFKPMFGSPSRGLNLAPSWVGDHFRRLQAYKLLESYYRNTARQWLDNSVVDTDDMAARREYGDPATVVDSIKNSVIGKKQAFMVGSTTEEQQGKDAKAQLEWYLKWTKKERFWLKFLESELQSVKLGDSVYVLGWDPKAGRVRSEVYDPGFYFPVLDPTQVSDEYPDKVHVAYEYTIDDPGEDLKTFVRRITWELIDTTELPVDHPDFGKTIKVPWEPKAITRQCFMSDGTWLVNEDTPEVDDFDESKADWEDFIMPDGTVDEFFQQPIGLDFIPVIHIPNTPTSQEHFGISSMATVLQLLDDIVSTDTDLQAASATTGTPPIALGGAGAPKDSEGNIVSYGPGTVFETGEGTATVIDTSMSLDALIKYSDNQLSRLSVNAKVPESVLGRVKPSEVPSGITLALSFAPHGAMVDEMRMVRDEKYELYFKFVARMTQVSDGDFPKGDILETHIKFGSYLPSNQKETVDLIVALRTLTPPGISLETSVRMLMEAGFSIEDAAAEVLRIEAHDYQGADDLLTATGDTALVADYLQVTIAPPEPAPGIDPTTGLPIQQAINPNTGLPIPGP